MLRNVFYVLVLATLAATSALATTQLSSARVAKPHKNLTPHSTARSGSHRAGRKAASRPASRNRSTAAARSGKTAHGRPRVANSRFASHRSIASARTLRRSLRPVTRPEFATPAAVVPASVTLRRRAMLPPPLRGSFESLARQNERAEADGLERILDEDDLADRIAQGLLVPVPASAALTIDATLPENHRYCRPWTATFLGDLSQAHAMQFRRPLFVSSAVRTVDYQQQLTRYNGNAAAAEGDIVSPHLTGGTIDIAKNGMSRHELAWMRNWLMTEQLAGMIDVEEEFRQPCFHITVYKSYVSPALQTPARRARRRAAPESAAAATPGL